MENYIVVNGKKAELTEEQLIKLGIRTENPEEKYPAKFKAGDRVKVICSTKTLGRGEEYEGEIFTINRVYTPSYYPNCPAPNIRAYGIGRTYVVFENELELASYEEIFERSLNIGYYLIGNLGNVIFDKEEHQYVDNGLYDVGNYCKDKEVMKQRALHETLNRLLWRASIIAGELDNSWNGTALHWNICMSLENTFSLRWSTDCKHQGICYFPTEESANDAIENIIKPFMKEHPDFKW